MEKWSLSNLPPEGHQDVGRWFWDNCFLASEAEKDRLNLKERWKENHRIWRGGSAQTSLKQKRKITSNLIFANIQRTVANLTAKNPSAEVVTLDGAYLQDKDGHPITDQEGNPIPDDIGEKMTVRLKSWWNDTSQITALVDSALNMEIYGTTVEKSIYLPDKDECQTVVLDPWAFVIAPGNWSDINDAPYVGMAMAMRPDAVESMFGLEAGTINSDDVYSVLGEDREDNRPTMYGTNINSVPAGSNYGSKTMHPRSEKTGSEDRALVVELFVRDATQEIVVDEVSGEEIQRDKYPGRIRVVTICNNGDTVLFDAPNPSVNQEIDRVSQSNTYLYDHYPYNTATSYRDPSSFWGFAAAEQVGDLASRIGDILSRMYVYLARTMHPTLILPQDCGLTEADVTNAPGLVLRPRDRETALGIRFLDVPSLPPDFYRMFDMLVGMFDRVYQIEDADRGDTPNRVVAASAIVALQERNQVLMRHKIRQIDYMVSQRGRCCISYMQNFGVTSDPVKVDEEIKNIRGIDCIDRKFQYVVESGSTITQTTLQVQEQAIDLANNNHIDSQALLETLNFPGWRRIVERMAENGTKLDQAAQVFIQAGVPQETVMQLVQIAQQPQQLQG